MLFATGEVARLLGEAFLDPGEQLENTLHVGFEVFFVLAQEGAYLEVFFDRHPLEETAVLRNHRHTPLASPTRAPVGNFRAVEEDLSGRGHQHPEDGLERGGLARGVTSEKTDDLSRVDLQVYVLEHMNRPVVGVHFPELEDGSAFVAHEASPSVAGRPR